MPRGVHNGFRRGAQHACWKGGRRVSSGYLWMYWPGHHRATLSGCYVKHAVVVLEEKLGRPLEPWEDSHHKDGNKLNDAPDNLEALTHAEHTSYHTRHRPLRRETRTCVVCGEGIARIPSEFGAPRSRTTCGTLCRNRQNGQNRDDFGRFADAQKHQ